MFQESDLLRREYLSSAVSVLTNTPKISDITQKDIFRLNFSDSDEKQYDEIAVVKFFGLFNMLIVRGCSEMWPFRHLSNLVFRSC